MGRPYSFMDVAASLTGPGGVISFGYGSGNSDEGISIEPAGDKNTMTIGADGEGMHSLHADRSGVITVRLLQTSDTNAQMQLLYDAQTSNPSLHGQNTIVIMNHGSGDVTTATQCGFKKKPAVSYGKDGKMIEWAFDCVKIDTILGLY